MQTVDDLLDQVKAKLGITSDYKLAQHLKMTQHTIANYRHGRSRPDDVTLTRLAEIAGIQPAEVELLAVRLQAERVTNEEARKLWERIAQRLQGGLAHAAALLLAVVVSLTVVAKDGHAAPALSAEKPSLCILC